MSRQKWREDCMYTKSTTSGGACCQECAHCKQELARHYCDKHQSSRVSYLGHCIDFAPRDAEEVNS